MRSQYVKMLKRQPLMTTTACSANLHRHSWHFRHTLTKIKIYKQTTNVKKFSINICTSGPICIHSLFIFVQKDTEHTKAGKKKKIFTKETQCYGLSCERLRKDQVSISGKKWRSHRVCSLSQSDDVINICITQVSHNYITILG